jgi:multiple antibiotic resistance protein
MDLVQLGVNFFVALFALIDPIGNVPLFAAATSDATAPQRRQIAVYITLFSVAFLAFFHLTGLTLLEFFGISLPAFRIAGGILLFLLGLDMTRSDFLTVFADAEAVTQPKDPRDYVRQRFEKLLVPFAMPLLIGPGAISTVIIQAGEAQAHGLIGHVIGLLAIVAVGVTMLASFFLTTPISKLLGKVGMAIVVRVLGLVLCAMAVQFILAGLNEATHGVIRSRVALPYAQHHAAPGPAPAPAP